MNEQREKKKEFHKHGNIYEKISNQLKGFVSYKIQIENAERK